MTVHQYTDIPVHRRIMNIKLKKTGTVHAIADEIDHGPTRCGWHWDSRKDEFTVNEPTCRRCLQLTSKRRPLA